MPPDGAAATLREQAADWVVRLDAAGAGEDGEALRAVCAAWRAQSAEHERLFQQCRQLWQVVAPVAPRRGGKRRLGAALGVLALLAGLGQLPWKVWTADVRAPGDDLRVVPLADGSRITLNRGSAVDLEFDAGQRTVRLVRGELLAEVAADAAGRPFRVVGRDGTALARGTRYLVRIGAADTAVTVLESTVTVTTADPDGGHRDVHAGEQLRFDAGQMQEITPAPPGAAAWVQRRLVFVDAPLADVLAALEAQRGGWLRLSGEAASRMRFTGVLPVDDPDAGLALLQRALPLQTHRFTPYWVRVEAREPQ